MLSLLFMIVVIVCICWFAPPWLRRRSVGSVLGTFGSTVELGATGGNKYYRR
jgi:hypothetical protein